MDEVKLTIFSASCDTILPLPLADGGIKAGFPSPAQDYMSDVIDLNLALVKNAESTFYARVSGDSMEGAGICDGDLLVIDKSLEAHHGDKVVAYIDGEFTIKEYCEDPAHKVAWLLPANDAYPPIKITEETNFRVWGVVTYVIKKVR